MADEQISRTLALAWGLAAAPQRGPKRELSLERIVEAAIAIADTEGLPAVTMQRVARTFEFSTMALYRYVATKDELHHLMLDAALSGPSSAIDPGDWRAGLHTFMIELLESYRAHPWALDITLAPDIHLMPGQLRMADRGLRAMRGLNAPDSAKLGILMVFSAFTRGHASVEREVITSDELSEETRALLVEAVTAARFPDAVHLVRNGSYFGDVPGTAAGDPAQRPTAAEDLADIREFAAAVLLAGLEATLAPGAPELATPGAELSPQEALERAQTELTAATDLRKQAQRKVQEAEKFEAAARRERDRAKELAKAHQRQQRGR